MKNRLLLSAFALLAIGMCNEVVAADTVDYSKASDSNPIDMTSFIVNADYASTDGWSGSTPTLGHGNAEFWDQTFDTYQTITGLPNGRYELSLQGFYRAGSASDAYRAYVANDESVLVAHMYVKTSDSYCSIPLGSIVEGASNKTLSSYNESYLDNGYYVPNDMGSAAAYFNAGCYNNKLSLVVEDGTLTFGIEKTMYVATDWCMFGNWSLMYLGEKANLTSFIQNPDAAAETGWVIDKGTGSTNTATGQHYSGDANARYFDSWNPTVGALDYNATQTIKGLPNGTYTLKFAGRNSGTKGAFVYTVTGNDTVWVEMSANAIASVDGNGDSIISYEGDQGGSIWEDAAEGSAKKAVHDGKGYGWNIYETPTFEVTDNTLTIGITTDSQVSGVPFNGNWFSAVDFELYGTVDCIELLENVRYQVLDYATWLEIEGWKNFGQSLSESYESTYAIDTTSATAVSQEISRLNSLLSKYKKIVETVGSPISSFSFSTTVTLGDWDIALDENKNVAYVSGYNGSETNIVVPESFTYNNQEYYTVGVGAVSFWYHLWFNYGNIESVELPDILRFIGDNAFEGCVKLTKISIPSRVESIGTKSFYGCSSLTSLIIPNSVASIGEYAFSGCSSLKDIKLSESLTTIQGYTFYNCSSLESLIIPNSVASIGEYAFSGCSSLKDIKLSESLTTIQGYTFYNCSSLESLIIPNSVTSIGEHVFQNCSSLTSLQSEATTAPTCAGSFYASNLRTVYVPVGSGASYRGASYWKNYIIVDGEGVSVTVNVETPGTLGDLILAQVENLSDVNHLTVTGSLNDDDIYNIQSRMPNLLTIDLSGIDMTALPENMFYQRYALQQVILPASLTSIGRYAFYQCYELQDVELPATLSSIGTYAFKNCDNIKHVIIPEGVTTVGSNAFEYCDALQTVKWASTATTISGGMFSNSSIENIEIPEGVTSIGSNAFSYSHLKTLECPSTLSSIGSSAFYACYSLASVKFNEGLESLGENAFYNCDMLTEVVLPSTLFDCNKSFNDCDSLSTVKCLALLPPYLHSSDPLYDVNKELCTLYVPAWTINKYKQTVGWDAFPVIKPLENYLPEYIKPSQDVTLTLPDTLPADYKPVFVGGYDVEGDHYAALTVNGSGTFSIKEFSLSYDVEWEARCSGAYITHNTLVNNVTMRADSVYMWVEIKNNQWSFLSFPFDVEVSDIQPTQKNTNYVIRRYSGKDRAEANFAGTWQDMTVDSILHAGEGYIWQSSRYDDAGNSQSSSTFIVSAINNTNKNLIFANSDRTVALNEHLSEFSHNRSWNLIGNPYPCYYDTRATDFTAPITVWNMSKSTYNAYSPIDDEYILRPGEAFFVQRPVDQESITFSTTGRQTDRTVRDITAVTGARSVSAPRQVFNIYLSNDSLSDHARFVINAKAEMSYNMSHDAGKFMSSDAMTPQLFTIESGVHYAINERPMGDGVIVLGTYFGSEGVYTLALDTKVQTEVILVDKLIGKEVNLAAADYTFSAEAGTVTDRFEIKFGGATSVEENLAQHVSVQAVGGQIVVNGAEDVEAVVYTTDGKQIAIVKGNAALEVNPGLYIVKVQGKSYKVSVVR